MIMNFSQRKPIIEMCAEGGSGKLTLDKLLSKPNAPESVRMYAKASLEPGASVGYHVHNGESETYFILSGRGEYNDNGKVIEVSAGDVTFTPSGEGHGIKNTGFAPLEFMALIIEE